MKIIFIKLIDARVSARAHNQRSLSLPATRIKRQDTNVKIKVLGDNMLYLTKKQLQDRVTVSNVSATRYIYRGRSSTGTGAAVPDDDVPTYFRMLSWSAVNGDDIDYIDIWFRVRNDCSETGTSSNTKVKVTFGVTRVGDNTNDILTEETLTITTNKTTLRPGELLSTSVQPKPPEGILAQRQYVKFRQSLETFAEGGDHTRFYQHCDNVRNGSWFSQHSYDLTVIMLIEEYGLYYVQNKPNEGKQCLDKIHALLPEVTNRNLLEGRYLCNLASYYRKTKNDPEAMKYVQHARSTLSWAHQGEDAALVMYNDARHLMSTYTTEKAPTEEELAEILEALDLAIAYYKQDKFQDNVANKICRCLFIQAQAALDCPMSSSTWYQRPMTKEARLKDGQKYLDILITQFREFMTGKTKCRVLYTEAGLRCRRYEWSQAIDKINSALEIAQELLLSVEEDSCQKLKNYCEEQLATKMDKNDVSFSSGDSGNPATESDARGRRESSDFEFSWSSGADSVEME